MKSYLSLFAIIALFTQACGGSNDSKSGTQVEVSPITAASSSEENVFSIQQATTAFDLLHVETEAVYETRTVQDTCYRTVQNGTRTECRNENDRQCSTQNDQVCRDVQTPVCQNVPRRVCQNVPQQVCQNVPRNVCSTVQQCTTQNDQVCRGTPPNQTCTNVPRRVCNPVQQCRTQNDSVCHTENREQCSTVNDSVCHNESRRECSNVPRQVCNDVPRQVCQQVPQTIQQPYSCNRDEQVQVGERIKSKVTANVKVIVTNFGSINLSQAEFLATLNGTDVALSMNSISNVNFRVVKKDRIPQSINSTEKQVQITYYIEVFQLN